MTFIIKCNNCGQEQGLESTEISKRSWSENDAIEIGITGSIADMMEVYIKCKCGTEVCEY